VLDFNHGICLCRLCDVRNADMPRSGDIIGVANAESLRRCTENTLVWIDE
jgi:hypothetical protein